MCIFGIKDKNITQLRLEEMIMKKTAIALALATLASSAVYAAPQENTFYLGGRLGWSQMFKLNAEKDRGFGYPTKEKRADFTYGLYAGYQIIDYLGVELAYDNFGGFKQEEKEAGDIKMRNFGPSLSLKGSYPVIENLDVYGRIGAAWVRSNYDVGGKKEHTQKLSPIYAVGVEYAPIPEVGLRLEYSLLDQVSRGRYVDGKKFDPRIGALTFGVSYRFGQMVPVAPVKVSETFVLNSDVTFAFGKAELKPDTKIILDDIATQMVGASPEKMVVAGFTDRIGSKQYNQRLSQQRADAVVNYLETKGVPANIITSVGYGSQNPIVQCNNERGNTLVKCLAPNRRVEIVADGTN